MIMVFYEIGVWYFIFYFNITFYIIHVSTLMYSKGVKVLFKHAITSLCQSQYRSLHNDTYKRLGF